MQCVRMPRANLEGATLRGCIMDSQMGINTNLEGKVTGALYPYCFTLAFLLLIVQVLISKVLFLITVR